MERRELQPRDTLGDLINELSQLNRLEIGGIDDPEKLREVIARQEDLRTEITERIDSGESTREVPETVQTVQE